jgi:hypothetical protein
MISGRWRNENATWLYAGFGDRGGVVAAPGVHGHDAEAKRGDMMIETQRLGEVAMHLDEAMHQLNLVYRNVSTAYQIAYEDQNYDLAVNLLGVMRLLWKQSAKGDVSSKIGAAQFDLAGMIKRAHEAG